MHAAEVFRTLQVLRQQIDRNRRGVGGQDSVLTNRIFGFTKNRVFHIRILNHGFYNQVDVLEVTVVQGRRDAVKHVSHLIGLHLALLDPFGQKLLGFLQAQGDTVLVDVLHDDRRAFQGGLERNATTHDTGAEYGGQVHVIGFFFPALAFFLSS